MKENEGIDAEKADDCWRNAKWRQMDSAKWQTENLNIYATR